MSRTRRLLSITALLTGVLASIATSEEIPEGLFRGAFDAAPMILAAGESTSVELDLEVASAASTPYHSEVRVFAEVVEGRARVQMGGSAEIGAGDSAEVAFAPTWRCADGRCVTSVVVDFTAVGGATKVDWSIEAQVFGAHAPGADREVAIEVRSGAGSVDRR